MLLWIVTDDGIEVMSQFENLYLIFFWAGHHPSSCTPSFLGYSEKAVPKDVQNAYCVEQWREGTEYFSLFLYILLPSSLGSKMSYINEGSKKIWNRKYGGSFHHQAGNPVFRKSINAIVTIGPCSLSRPGSMWPSRCSEYSLL